MDHLNLVFVVPFSSQAKLITGLESLRFPSLRFRVFYIQNTTSPSVRRQWERRVSDEIRRRREWIPRADGCSSDVIVRTRHGLCMRLSWLIVMLCKCCIILDVKNTRFGKSHYRDFIYKIIKLIIAIHWLHFLLRGNLICLSILNFQ